MAECPTPKELANFVAGLKTGPQAEALANHIQNCPDCQRRADQLQEDERLAQRLRQAINVDGSEPLRRQLQDRMAGDYQVLRVIGAGASGVVFQARDVHLDRLVAIKCPADKTQRGRLVSVFNEARILATINHPNVAAVHALSENPDLPFIVMEFVDGLPIDEALAQAPLDQKLAVFQQVLQGVAELHRRGIVHRDLKPDNILVDHRGKAKVVDLGIAEKVWKSTEMTLTSPTAKGTPAYLAPEQSRGEMPRPATDVFSLGIVLFELLTGQRPFAGGTVQELIRAIREADPPLPRTLDSQIPGPLQAICLTALEKDPSCRYASAREFLLDVERFSRGEAVIANPQLLAGVLEHGIDRHLANLKRWQREGLISPREYDYFSERYDRLRDREDVWILESRRLTFSQIALILGAWSCVVSAALMVFFVWATLSDFARIALPLAVFLALAITGWILWRLRTRRVGLVFLMAGCLTWPLLMATVFLTEQWHWLSSSKDLFPNLTNTEFFVATATWSALSLLLWLHTRTGTFALIWSVSALALATAVFALMGMKEWQHDSIAVWYLVPGVALFSLAVVLDLRWRQVPFAAPLYIIAMLVLLTILSWLAVEGPTTKWLGVDALARELGADQPDREHQIKYSFAINGAAYLLLGLLMDRSRRSWWLRKVAILLFWLAPSHMLVPVRLLADEWPLLPGGWTVPEVLLPIGALCFVIASVPKQMKSFFFSGLGYLAVAAQRLTAAHFENVYAWPVGLAVVGLGLAILAWRQPAIFDKSGPLPLSREVRVRKKPQKVKPVESGQ